MDEHEPERTAKWDDYQYALGMVTSLASILGRVSAEIVARDKDPERLLNTLLKDAVEEEEMWGNRPYGEGCRQAITVIRLHVKNRL